MKPRIVITILTIGVAAGLISIFLLPSQFEILLWVVLAVVLGKLVQSSGLKRVFLGGLLGGALAGFAITMAHIAFVQDYMATHKEEMNALQPYMVGASYRLTLFVMAPVYWLILGIATGVAARVWRSSSGNS